MQIARSVELAKLANKPVDSTQLEVTADAALRLLDSYVLSTQAMLSQRQLILEPVSVTATLYDASQYLYKLGRLYNCELELNASSKLGLAMAHPEGLQAAITSLGYSFIQAIAGDGKPEKLQLIARTDKEGVRIGVLTESAQLGGSMLRQARSLYGQVRQPLAEFTHNTAAGIFVADSLFDQMSTQLRVVRGRKTSGLVATLLPSQQLALL